MRVAFITGASYGIGAACALALARDGFDVAVSGTRLDNVAATCGKLQALGVKALPVALDLRSHDAVKTALAKIFDAFGGIDVLVNNAGVTVQKPALDITPAEWSAVIDCNLTGTFFLTQELGRRLIEAHRPGCIISVTSVHGIVGWPGRVAYGSSKAAVIQMTKLLAIEWAQHGIRLNAVAPGRVNTESPERAADLTNKQYMQAALGRIPLGRFCTVEDVAEAVRYLASPAAEYITGHTLVLDGGITAA